MATVCKIDCSESMKEKYIDINQHLIIRCRKNDQHAQLSIYKLYYKAMYNTSFRIVNNTADAEDMMQEAFLEAFRKISDYKSEGSFGSWLKRIVINKSLDFIKKKQIRISLGQKILEMEELKHEDEKDLNAIDLQMEEVKSAMQRIPENYRIILSLFLMEGYDHQEIAQILSIPYNNTRTRYSRARQRLIKEIQLSRTDNHHNHVRT